MLKNIPLFSVQTKDQTQIGGQIIHIESATLNIGKEQKVQFNAGRYSIFQSSYPRGKNPVKLYRRKDTSVELYNRKDTFKL